MSGSSDLKSVLKHVCPQKSSKWHEFGKAVGMNEELLIDLFNYDSEESLQMVLDYWIKSSNSKPTWRDKNVGKNRYSQLCREHNKGACEWWVLVKPRLSLQSGHEFWSCLRFLELDYTFSECKTSAVTVSNER